MLWFIALLCCGQIALADDWSHLLDRSQQQGSVRVIVQLQQPALLSGLSVQAGRAAQRQGIAVAQQQLLERLAGQGLTATPLRRFEHIAGMALRVDSAALQALRDDPAVLSLQEDRLARPLLAQSIPLINADDLWALGGTGDGWAVAVLDTGVDYTHEFFTGKLIAEACFSSDDVDAGASSLCPDGAEESFEEGAGLHCSGIDGCAHGTQVAGIAVGQGTTRNGVAKAADLIAIQVFSRIEDVEFCDGSNPCLASYGSDQIAALGYLTTLHDQQGQDIAAVNLSLGEGAYGASCDGSNTVMKAAVDALRSRGIATIASSGNEELDGEISAPACISSVIAVGATNKQDGLASFSNHSELVDLLAPGVLIQTSNVVSGYVAVSGTSASAPHVAGAWAAFKSLYPELAVGVLLDMLKQSGVSIATREPPKPRIDLLAAHGLLVTEGLLVEILPVEVRELGARWRLLGEGDEAWRESGVILRELVVGDEYQVEFSPLSGWRAPATQTISILEGQLTNLSVSYTRVRSGGGGAVSVAVLAWLILLVLWSARIGAAQSASRRVSRR
ncbi:MAG: S8 family serine peptidase [Gammaproteobacteria bacterium]|nr:S8 family serine peptidase [Gammaproteobacteria bacterium]